MDSHASHRYGAIGDRTLCVGVLYAAGVKVGSLAHYIGASSGAHCPLIEEIGPDQDRNVDLVPCGPSALEINSNNMLQGVNHKNEQIGRQRVTLPEPTPVLNPWALNSILPD
jgi:hypothetical protein